MSKIKIGMIGAGFIGQLAHLMNFVELNNCEVNALAELRPDLRRKVAARYNIPKNYASHLDLIMDKEIDAVVVVTARPFTAPIVLDCLKAGKHVLSEKPMAGCSEEARCLLAAANDKKLHYAVGYMKRYDAGVEFVKTTLQKIIAQEELGQIISVHAKCFMGNSYCNAYGHVTTDEKVETTTARGQLAPTWLPEKFQQPFSAYLNTYSHLTNLLRYLFNETPIIRYTDLTSHAGQIVVLGFNLFEAVLETGKMSHASWSEEIKITFTDGEITLALPPALLRNVPAFVEIYRAGKIQEKMQPQLNWSWAFKRQAEHFVKDIIEKKDSRISAHEAYQDLQLIESIWKSEMNKIKNIPLCMEKAI